MSIPLDEDEAAESQSDTLTFTDIIVELMKMATEIQQYKSVIVLGSLRDRRRIVLERAAAIVARAQASHRTRRK